MYIDYSGDRRGAAKFDDDGPRWLHEENVAIIATLSTHM